SLTFGCLGHVNDSALMIFTRRRPQMAHVPDWGRVTSRCNWQLHTSSSRTGVSGILQIGHPPFWSSTTSGCIGQVQERGSSAFGGSTATVAASIVKNSRRFTRFGDIWNLDTPDPEG